MVSGVLSLASAHCHWPTPALIHRIGKLRSIFSDIGRQGDWNRTLLIGNPASDLLVKQYLKEFTPEQLRASIAPKQAVPLFVDKLLLFSRHIEKSLLLSSLSPTEMFVPARDQAFFKALFFSGDRGGDLGLDLVPVFNCIFLVMF